MSKLNVENLPVIVGVGEIIDKPESGEVGLEPLQLIERAICNADCDAGGGWIPKVDQLNVIPQLTWPYEDLAGEISARLGIAPKVLGQADVSGDSAVKALLDAAESIYSGQASTVLVCGAEAMQSLRTAGFKGVLPDQWTSVKRAPKAPDGADYVTPLAVKYDLQDPTEAYTLYENATRHAWGLSVDEAQQVSSELWQQYAEVASRNPYAWDKSAPSAVDIKTPDKKNPFISYPYTKRMVAQMFVNLGSAFVVTNLSSARQAGIPEESLVYVGAGVSASDIDDFLTRENFHYSTPMALALEKTLSLNNLKAEDLDLLELYSCFPCVPKMAKRVLKGLKADILPTTAGGLSFLGGPMGNYMSHAVAAMVRQLRDTHADNGLLYGNGGWLTKHCAAILSVTPPTAEPGHNTCSDIMDSLSGKGPVLLEQYSGPAHVETFMVRYGKYSDPQHGSVVARTPNGERVVAKVTPDNKEALQTLTDMSEEPIGKAGEIKRVEGINVWSFA